MFLLGHSSVKFVVQLLKEKERKNYDKTNDLSVSKVETKKQIELLS